MLAALRVFKENVSTNPLWTYYEIRVKIRKISMQKSIRCGVV